VCRQLVPNEGVGYELSYDINARKRAVNLTQTSDKPALQGREG
jgi:hypothetical protein